MATLLQYTNGERRFYGLTNNVERGIWFYHDDIEHCFSGNKMKYIMDWPIPPNTWLVNMQTDLSRAEVLALVHIGFQVQQREALLSCCMFSTITTLLIPQSNFLCATKIGHPPNFQVLKDHISESNNTNVKI